MCSEANLKSTERSFFFFFFYILQRVCTSAGRLGNLTARLTAQLLSSIVAEEDNHRHQKNGSEADTDDDALYVDPALPGTLLHRVLVRYREKQV